MKTLLIGSIAVQPLSQKRSLLSIPALAAILVVAQALSAKTIRVPAGGDFQAALDHAKSGDTIELQANAVYSGVFKLLPKSGNSYITIQSSDMDYLPPAGSRIDPSYSPHMPKLMMPLGGAALTATSGSAYYQLVGIEFLPDPSLDVIYNIVSVGEGTETSASQLPHDIVFDRDYIHGDPIKGGQRGISLNGASTTIENCYISDIKMVETDTQAIAGWNGTGPFTIVNNYLEGASENVMFGGSTPTIPGLVPSDIVISHNYFYKPFTWRIGDPSYGGVHWTVKSLLELKNAQRLTIDGNVFENCWADGAMGTAVVMNAFVSDGANPWATVQHVTFTHNIIRHASSALVVSGATPGLLGYAGDMLIQNNLFEDISRANWGGPGWLYQVYDGPANMTFDHNTGFPDAAVTMFAGPGKSEGFTYTNNLTPDAIYGIDGDGSASGNGTIATYTSNSVFGGDILYAKVDGGSYPSGFFFPSTVDDVGFVDYAHADYHLALSSPYKNAGTDGKDIGADIDSINRATSGVTEGTPVKVVTPEASLSASSLSFATEAVSTTSPAQVVTLSDSGTAPLVITSIGITGDNAGDFAESSNCPVSPSALAPGSSCEIQTTFTPTALGTRTAAINIADNASPSSQTIALTGLAGTTMSISPTSLSFGTEQVGTSGAQSLTLTNASAATLMLWQIGLTGRARRDYAFGRGCGFSLAPGSSCEITVTFRPRAAGVRTALLLLTYSGTGGSVPVVLTGTGTVQ
jgi:hypothetical protein